MSLLDYFFYFDYSCVVPMLCDMFAFHVNWVNIIIVGFLLNLFLFLVSKTYRQIIIGVLGGDIGFYA